MWYGCLDRVVNHALEITLVNDRLILCMKILNTTADFNNYKPERSRGFNLEHA
jgi:hypothetical protein